MTALHSTNERWLIVNPTSGTADHLETVRSRGTNYGYSIHETEYAGHAIELAREAATNDVDVLAVAGGDGTLHEVVHGLADVDALDAVTVGVLPLGTENIFATNIGVMDLDQGFDVLEQGERRRIDIGFAGDEPVVMSCIAGLPADASVAASSELKEHLGSLAFAISGVQEVAAFDGLHIELAEVTDGKETIWRGDALCALVGNSRRFAKQGGQANIEDGLLDVVIIEEMPMSDIVTEAAAQRILGWETEHVIHRQASELEIASVDGESIDFSLDGELRTQERVRLQTHQRALTVCVGPEYTPTPRTN